MAALLVVLSGGLMYEVGTHASHGVLLVEPAQG